MALPFLESRRVLYKKSIIYQCFGEPAKVVLLESAINTTFTEKSESVRAGFRIGEARIENVHLCRFHFSRSKSTFALQSENSTARIVRRK